MHRRQEREKKVTRVHQVAVKENVPDKEEKEDKGHVNEAFSPEKTINSVEWKNRNVPLSVLDVTHHLEFCWLNWTTRHFCRLMYQPIRFLSTFLYTPPFL